MRKRLLVLFGVLVLLAVGVGLMVDRPKRGISINRENWEKIEQGMSYADVVEILGCPAGNYASKSKAADRVQKVMLGVVPDNETRKAWSGDIGHVLVIFDQSGKVEDTHFVEQSWLEQSFRDRLRRRLGL